MTQTLRRELRLKFQDILNKYPIQYPACNPLADDLADAAIEVRGIAKAAKPDLMDGILQSEAKAQGMDEAFVAFEKAMATPHNWSWYPAKSSDESAWTALREFVVKTYRGDPRAFEKYAAWRAEKYSRGAMSNLAIRRAPAEFEISYSDFLASSSMYGKKEEYTRML